MRNLFKQGLYQVIIGIMVVLLVGPLPAFADDPEPQLHLKRAPFQDSQRLLVDIVLTDVQDLYGAEIQLQYNPDQLIVQDEDPVTEGTQLILGSLFPQSDRLVVINSAEAETGIIKLVVTLLNPAPPVNENGTVASVMFQVNNSTEAISVEVLNAKLISVNLDKIPVNAHDLIISTNGSEQTVATPPSTVDPSATIEVTPPIDGSTSPYASWGWMIALLTIVLLLLIVIILLLRAQSTNDKPVKTVGRRMPGATFSSGRSSSLLTRQGNEALAHEKFEAAYEYFSQAVELDPANAEAWLGKGLVAQQEAEKRICLQRVVALDPTNETAKMALKQLGKSRVR